MATTLIQNGPLYLEERWYGPWPEGVITKDGKMVINRSATVVPGSQRDGYFFVRENDGQGDIPLPDGTAFTLIFAKDADYPNLSWISYQLTGAIQT